MYVLGASSPDWQQVTELRHIWLWGLSFCIETRPHTHGVRRPNVALATEKKCVSVRTTSRREHHPNEPKQGQATPVACPSTTAVLLLLLLSDPVCFCRKAVAQVRPRIMHPSSLRRGGLDTHSNTGSVCKYLSRASPGRCCLQDDFDFGQRHIF